MIENAQHDTNLMRAVLENMRDVAEINCARPPFGQRQHHYKDPDCGACTSCVARRLMKEIA